MCSFVIHRKFVVGVGLFDVFVDRSVLLNVVFQVDGVVLLVYLSVLMLVFVVDFDILRGFGCRIAVYAF